MDKKASLYVERGARLVWMIWPSSRTADVWRLASPHAPVATLTVGDQLDGLNVLPGFILPLATLLC